MARRRSTRRYLFVPLHRLGYRVRRWDLHRSWCAFTLLQAQGCWAWSTLDLICNPHTVWSPSMDPWNRPWLPGDCMEILAPEVASRAISSRIFLHCRQREWQPPHSSCSHHTNGQTVPTQCPCHQLQWCLDDSDAVHELKSHYHSILLLPQVWRIGWRWVPSYWQEKHNQL